MSSDEIIFDAAIRTNTSIEIWKFNFFNGSWRQVDTLEYHNSGSWELDPFTIDFLQREKTFQIFWDQEVIHLLHEIFTVQYDPESEDWGSIIQVTDTNTISDDFEGGVPGLTLVTVVITLLAAIFFRKTALFITRF
jgi:hypothetical protein